MIRFHKALNRALNQ